MLNLILLIAAFILFVLAAVNVASRVNLVAALTSLGAGATVMWASLRTAIRLRNLPPVAGA